MGRRNAIFHFKQFTIDHAGATMKVGTDAVLLGAWANVGESKRLLDIGTGSGVIALMLAQRTIDNATIDAIEIEPRDAEQARTNVSNSPWPHKVKVHVVSAQEFASIERYDCIVSNPPFFSNSFQPPDPGRGTARHTNQLPFSDLIDIVKKNLHEHGTFSVIVPYNEGNTLIAMATTSGLRLTRQCIFRGRPDKPPERLLLEFKKTFQTCEMTELTMYEKGNEWSKEYVKLTRDFYLKF
jgi:tRNA1Val (adenine37-N6)-methyltransferase